MKNKQPKAIDFVRAWLKALPKDTPVVIHESGELLVIQARAFIKDFQFAYKFEDKKKKK